MNEMANLFEFQPLLKLERNFDLDSFSLCTNKNTWWTIENIRYIVQITDYTDCLSPYTQGGLRRPKLSRPDMLYVFMIGFYSAISLPLVEHNTHFKGSLNISEYRCLLIGRVLYLYTMLSVLCNSLISGAKK